ncbi:MAG: AmmeMemoRadiSam system protein B [Pseudomonadota bacterium]
MSPDRIRPAAVAGMFYPGDRQALAQTLDAMLAACARQPAPQPAPKAIIVPHAGYIYSGPVAASAYALLGAARSSIRRVVLLGPAHRVAVRGLALPAAGKFATPLGTIDVDRDAVAMLRKLPQITVSDEAHALEHSLEVHLPFLQTVLEKFTLVPLAVGHADPAAVAAVLDALWGGPETLVVISTDLSHYHSHREAQRMDRETADAILDSRTDITHEQACGATPVTGLAIIARRRGLTPELVDLRNSGDTAGDKNRVVGYGAFAYFENGRHAH